MDIINWPQVAAELTPTHILVAVSGYIIVHLIIRALKLALLITKGAALSDTRRALAYMHGRQGHTDKFGECMVGDCIYVTVSSPASDRQRQAA